MDPSAWRSAGKFYDHRGHAVFYREEGGGDPVLLIHGFPTASWDWHAVWPRLLERYRLIAPDLMGFGFSAKPRTYGYTIFDQADLCEGLLASLGVERAHVLAHDYGDTVAQELLARHEDRRVEGRPGLAIRSLCLLNGGLFPETHRARRIQKLLLTPLGPVLGRLMSERSFARSFAAVFGPETRPSEAELHAFWTLVRENGGHRIAHKLIRYIEERRRNRERWVEALRRTRVPLRLVNGPEDPVSGRHMAARYRELIPDPDIVLLERIGHYPQIEDPEGVLRAYTAFVEGTSSSVPP